jgi:hypothetical protein
VSVKIRNCFVLLDLETMYVLRHIKLQSIITDSSQYRSEARACWMKEDCGLHYLDNMVNQWENGYVNELGSSASI